MFWCNKLQSPGMPTKTNNFQPKACLLVLFGFSRFMHSYTDMCMCALAYPLCCKTSTGARLDPAVRPPLSQPIMITLRLLPNPCIITTYKGEIRPFQENNASRRGPHHHPSPLLSVLRGPHQTPSLRVFVCIRICDDLCVSLRFFSIESHWPDILSPDPE